MAITTKGFRPVKTLNNAPPAMQMMPFVVTATAYKAGQVLRLSATTGSCARFAANGTSIVGVLACDIASGHATAADGYPVYLADGNTVFEAQMLPTGGRQARVGDFFEVKVTTTHNYWLEGTGTLQHCKAIGFNPDAGLATSKFTSANKYWVIFNQEYSILTGEGQAQ